MKTKLQFELNQQWTPNFGIRCGLLLGCLTLITSQSLAALIFTQGTDAAAGSNSGYAAVRFRNFANSGGANGEVYIGNQINLGGVNTSLYGINNTAWSEQTYSFSYTYDPTDGIASTTLAPLIAGNIYNVFHSITVPSAPANELQILDRNGGSGDLILNLTSINSVGNGGTFTGSGSSLTVVGGAKNFAPTATWTASGGAYLQSYLADDTLFNSGFTLHGLITLNAPISTYSRNEGSKIEINLAHTSNLPVAAVPEPNISIMLGLGLLGVGVVRRYQKRSVVS